MPRKQNKVSPGTSREREEAVKAAVKAVKEGQSIRNAAKCFGVPYTTLHDHCCGELEKYTCRQCSSITCHTLACK